MQNNLTSIESAQNHGVDLKETDANPAGVKAVFAFMDGQDSKVVDILMAGIKASPLDETLWRLNMDMLRVLDDQHTFDQLSIKFAEKFNMSPPSWVPITIIEEEVDEVLEIADITIKISTVDKNSMMHLLNPAYVAAGKGGIITFDFSSVGNSDKDGLIILSNGLIKLVEMQSDIKFIFFDKFIKAISEHAKKSGKDLVQLWDMSFLMMRISGMESLFEDFSIAYAGEFDRMPTVWEPYTPASKELPKEIVKESSLQPIEGAFSINGRVNLIQKDDLDKIYLLIQQGKLILDMRACIRMALGPSEALSSLINRSTRPIIITGANAMVKHSLMFSALLPMPCAIFKEA